MQCVIVAKDVPQASAWGILQMLFLLCAFSFLRYVLCLIFLNYLLMFSLCCSMPRLLFSTFVLPAFFLPVESYLLKQNHLFPLFLGQNYPDNWHVKCLWKMGCLEHLPATVFKSYPVTSADKENLVWSWVLPSPGCQCEWAGSGWVLLLHLHINLKQLWWCLKSWPSFIFQRAAI